MKEAENKVVTPFVSQTELKARQSKAMQISEDIHVGPNTQLSGGFSTNGMMIVDGRVDNGDIAADRLIISHIGNLEGKVVVHRAEISGVFSGDLQAGDEVIVRPTARISGTVQCQKLVIHRGARIECSFSCMSEVAVDGDAAPVEAQRNGLFKQRLSASDKRERMMFVAGAGTVLALTGAFAMLMGMKALLS